MKEPKSHSESLDQHLRHLAARLLHVDPSAFDSDHGYGRGKCMGRLPLLWEQKLIKRLCEIVPKFDETKWLLMKPHSYGKLRLLRQALRLMPRMPKRGRPSTFTSDARKIAKEYYDSEVPWASQEEFRKARYPNKSPSTISRALEHYRNETGLK